MREIEIKLPVRSVTTARRAMRRLGFEPLGRRLLEHNVVFDSPDHALRLSQQLLRLRSKGGRWWLTFKTPPEAGARHKVREETEVEVQDGKKLTGILVRLGYYPAFQYQKYRTEFHQPGRAGKLLLDETPIGDFIELEGPPRWIDRTAKGLGYASADYILASYGALYFAWREERGLLAGDMVFQKQVKRQKSKGKSQK